MNELEIGNNELYQHLPAASKRARHRPTPLVPLVLLIVLGGSQMRDRIQFLGPKTLRARPFVAPAPPPVKSLSVLGDQFAVTGVHSVTASLRMPKLVLCHIHYKP